jgi:phosphoribosylanthranilate isomerase
VTRVKMCGLMSTDDVGLAVTAGADALGFVTEYPQSVPWNLTRDRAAALVAAAPPFVTTTAVVGGAVEVMLAIAATVQPHFLQLHGDETADEIEAVCAGLAGSGTKVIKALRVDIDSGEAMFVERDPVKAATILASTGIAGLVLDSKTANRPAGTGIPLDWGVAARVAASSGCPLILAGGLSADNVGAAIDHVHPYGVDVISGVESERGVKDGCRMRAFMATVRATDGQG